MDRRQVMKGGLALSGLGLFGGRAPALMASERIRPTMPYGCMSGDLLADRAMIWAASDRPARMVVEWSRDPGFARTKRVTGPLATVASDLTAKMDLIGLPAGEAVHYRVAFQDLDDARAISEWSAGQLRLPSPDPRPIRFTFAGDEAGQGFGIDRTRGGYKLYEAMRQAKPDFFIHQGDQIYADGVLKPQQTLPNGESWQNLMTPAKAKVADSLDDYRGCFAYNLLDENKRRFLAEVPMLVQWDDHEVRNNWFPDKPLPPGPTMAMLSAASRRAMIEYNPMRIATGAPGIQRSFAMGPLLEIFMLDERSSRGPNGPAASPEPGRGILGYNQLAWLKRGLAHSRATWKLIASDMPLSLTVPDLNKDRPPGGIEAIANGLGGMPGGREAEMADLLRFIKAQGIRNTVWISADVHYAAALNYHPDRAAFQDFLPFWEIVAGPINAGTGHIGMNPLDPTFGPEVVFASVPGAITDSSPAAGLQFFGLGEIDPVSKVLTITIRNATGRDVWSQAIRPEAIGQAQAI